MKKYLYLLILLIQANNSFAIELFSRGTGSSAAQKIEAIQQGAQKLLQELQELKKCRATNSCTKAQYDRITQLGKKIGAAVVVLIGVGVAAGLGIRSRMAPTMENAADRFRVDFRHHITGDNDFALLKAAADPDVLKIQQEFGFGRPKIYSLLGLEAAKWIIDNRQAKDQYERNQLIEIYNELTKRISKIEKELTKRIRKIEK